LFIVTNNEPFIKVQYTDEENLLNPKIQRVESALDIDRIGRYKSNIWNFEQEIRFRIFIFPIDNNKTQKDFPKRYSGLLKERVPPSINSYFLNINDDIFNSMKIRTGPRLVAGDIEIIRSLVEKYNPKCAVRKSGLSKYVN